MTKATKRPTANFTDKHEQHWRRLESQEQQRKQWANRKYGTLGAASPVRHIDPADYQPPLPKGSK